MIDYMSATTGLHPLPDWAKEELAELKGHQKQDLLTGDEGGEIVAAYDRARSDVVETQADAGLDLVSEGQLRWDDMLTHVLSVTENVETRGIVRYYDNNNFYRDPVVTGELEPTGDVARDVEQAMETTDATVGGVLPGPYSLAELASDEFYGEDRFLEALATFLADEAAELPDMDTVFLLEPSLAVDQPDEPVRVREAIETVADAIDASVLVHTYWGTVSETVYEQLLDASVDGVGFDLVTSRADSVSLVSEYGLTESVLLGVVNGQNTRLEDADDVRHTSREFVDRAAETPEQVYLSPNTELFYLPTNRCEAKLETLARAADTVEVST
ncbi:5-methyltetrahydropteroyltriglutamate--homocysteine methyltransferase [Haloarcula salinisoli]|uniref:5-methyltetrahydropteroyltriglutamate--homocysteine methyltransferase n=1 Tax=Haloarcula salinisoli TaxID=2487746 RepID=A0A8J7YIF5_9EURY|nr:5-methyltetrahydropteroyltriglutamate--homocysteine methyltransferase [Halomicroarcula salinisoli]MBX0306047.1 5-methyltetrahydropteroyltriglutamate--homocysteine methyltransferase [Halomicroarcula salinisoli]